LEYFFVALAQLGTGSHNVHCGVRFSQLGQQGYRRDDKRLANPARQPPDGPLDLMQRSERILCNGILQAAGLKFSRSPNHLQCLELAPHELDLCFRGAWLDL